MLSSCRSFPSCGSLVQNMQNSMKPVTGKRLSSISRSKSDSSTIEESGWTGYFDDLVASNSNNKEDTRSLSYDKRESQSSYIISDAASVAANEPEKKDKSKSDIHEKRIFKRSRRRRSLVGDDVLEDTASSDNGNNSMVGNHDSFVPTFRSIQFSTNHADKIKYTTSTRLGRME
uniref:Thrum style-specific protein 1 n=1 Tax=Linum grandiflorum TaxID=559336 RepID=G9M8Q0_9ROSI|nr:thrum style-specific protein 1 [Linum grandiflorum]